MKTIYRSFATILMICTLLSTEAFAANVVDSQAPVIYEDTLTISSTTATVGDTIVFSIEVTDNVAVSRVSINFWNNDSSEQIHGWMNQVDGTNRYEYQLTIDENTPSGTWRVFSLLAYDTTENVNSTYFNNEHTFLIFGASTSITIDTEDILIDKTTVRAGETVTISVKVTGDNIESVSFDLSNTVSGKTLQFLKMAYDGATGRYTYSLTVDDTIPAGHWQIGFINAQSMNHVGVAEFIGNLHPGFTVVGTNSDTEAPVIDNTTIAIANQEISIGESATLSVKITDNMEMGIVSLSIQNQETGKLLAYPQMTYNNETGFYEYTLTAYETIPSGHWRLCSIFANDAAGNLNLQSYFNWDYYILVKGENNHIYETDAAIAATCTSTGLTEGSSCSICGKVQVAQEETPMLDHDFSDTSKRTCANCNALNPNYKEPIQQPDIPNYPSIPPYYPPITPPSTNDPIPPEDSENTELVTLPFTDVADDAWEKDAVAFVYTRGLMKGISNTLFGSNVFGTRAMVVTMLARMEGVDTAGGATWYDEARTWAIANGISDGEYFHKNITREQLVTMLWRIAGKPSDGSLLGYTDGESVSSWARTAMEWAVSKGIISGKGNGILDPSGNTSRAEIAQIFMNYMKM